MAAAEDGASGDASAASAGRDLLSDLQSQVVSLRNRVEELEQENRRLQFLLSRCHCSKVPASGACTSHEGNSQDSHLVKEPHAAENSEIATEFHSDKLVLSSSNPVKDGSKSGFALCADNSSKSMKHELREEPGCYQRMHNQAKRYVALKIMYFGLRFYGFASEAQMEPTIESEIFKALVRTKLLVGNKEDSHYSRCGRTDKGVSSTGQVVSLYLRSKLNTTRGKSENDRSTLEENCEIDYVKVLNRVLPREIRVMGWCPVPLDFHARFSCLSREYRYLFWKGNLDILSMQKAADKFVGEYDFRNFCKMDAANVNNYRRQILFFDISSCNKRSIDDELWAMTIRGSAFLWHQVRCMVAVLFMIGQGLESPDVVNLLLDTKKTLRKPQYNMASDVPLILHYCEFENLNFSCSPDASRALYEHLNNEFQSYMLQAAIYHEALSCLPAGASESLRKKKSHISLMLRPTEPSYEERRARLEMKAAS